MNISTVKFEGWELKVDKELTYQTYLRFENPSAESCGCDNCRNFASQRDFIYPAKIKGLFDQLGIDYKKEVEVSHFTKLGNGLHFYSGWFHFKGDFTGKDCTNLLPGGGFTLDLTTVKANFSIGFRKDNALTPFEDQENLVQIEFECKIPWKIEKELETE